MEKEISLTTCICENDNENLNQEQMIRKSIVAIRFKNIYKDYSYYNDKFDLKIGDRVYVDGKLSGLIGEVVDVDYNFKINLSKYKRVVGVVDTSVKGTFYMWDNYFLTFDKSLSAQKILPWFIPINSEEEQYVSGSDDSKFELDEFKNMKIDEEIVYYGNIMATNDYFIKYLSVNDGKGCCLIDDDYIHDVDFSYKYGKVSNLVCDCYHTTMCRHKYASMIMLKKVVDYIKQEFQEEYEENKFFAIIEKKPFLEKAFNGNEKHRVVID